MNLTLTPPEKLAFVKMVDTVINADEVIHDAEIEIMSQFMRHLEFDSELVAKAKEENIEDCMTVLSSMTNDKKSKVIQMLNVVAMSDGFIHKNELNLILKYCATIGLCNEIG